MPDLAGDVGSAVIEPPIYDESAADAGPDRHSEHVSHPAGRAAPVLSERRAPGVIVERRRKSDGARDLVTQWKIEEAKIVGADNDSRLAIERAGRPDSNSDELIARRSRLAHRVRDDFRGQRSDSRHHARRSVHHA